jgi:hypothetical protein
MQGRKTRNSESLAYLQLVLKISYIINPSCENLQRDAAQETKVTDFLGLPLTFTMTISRTSSEVPDRSERDVSSTKPTVFISVSTTSV